MKRGEPGTGGRTTPNIDTRNVAPAGEEPHFVGPPCHESGCNCHGWEGEAGGMCAAVDAASGKRCSHPLSAHY